ncbi:MAG: acyl carrier protein [Thermoleophilaceae bacterium]|jgi:acyl carrier protein|nr:acyl carrier protein [Thermoleophilaceae bacterium]
MTDSNVTVDIEELVIETLKELAGEPDAVTADATLEQIDVDSLDLAELSQVVEEKLGVTLKGSDVAEVTTVADAIALIQGRMGQ